MDIIITDTGLSIGAVLVAWVFIFLVYAIQVKIK